MYCKAKVITDNCKFEPKRPIGVQLFDWSTTARKIVLFAANTMSKSKTVLEMTAPALTDTERRRRHCCTSAACNDGVIQLSPLSSDGVLEVVEISHASFVHFFLQYVPQTCSQLDLNPANLEARIEAE